MVSVFQRMLQVYVLCNYLPQGARVQHLRSRSAPPDEVRAAAPGLGAGTGRDSVRPPWLFPKKTGLEKRRKTEGSDGQMPQ